MRITMEMTKHAKEEKGYFLYEQYLFLLLVLGYLIWKPVSATVE